jgi:hypothetical protein
MPSSQQSQQLTGRVVGCEAAYVVLVVLERDASTISFGYVVFGPVEVCSHSRSLVSE